MAYYIIMKTEIDTQTGEAWIRHSQEETMIGFMAQCIEGMAEKDNCSYLEMFRRLEDANLTEGYILRFYDVLHTESWENILEELMSLLKKREQSKTA